MSTSRGPVLVNTEYRSGGRVQVYMWLPEIGQRVILTMAQAEDLADDLQQLVDLHRKAGV